MILEQKTNTMVIPTENIQINKNNHFIEANTLKVDLDHLKSDCIIPVFSKDNEITISHYDFISRTTAVLKNLYPNSVIAEPDIRVSHIIKGRIPSAIGKSVKELTKDEKTIYYERCAFLIEIPEIHKEVNGNKLKLSIGGVRAYNQENLYSKKSPEKFKIFIGFKNMVCTNLCISTDGFVDSIRINHLNELEYYINELISNYSLDEHLDFYNSINQISISESRFAHLIGKLRMWSHLDKNDSKKKLPIGLSDSQINKVINDYYHCENFKKSHDGSINLWNLYNLFTEANKSSYIDKCIERNVKAHALIQELHNSIVFRESHWLLG